MITVTTEDQPTPTSKPYPKLMIHDAGHIAIMKSSGVATYLKHTNPDNVGKSFANLSMVDFVDYVGELTLENV